MWGNLDGFFRGVGNPRIIINGIETEAPSVQEGYNIIIWQLGLFYKSVLNLKDMTLDDLLYWYEGIKPQIQATQKAIIEQKLKKGF